MFSWDESKIKVFMLANMAQTLKKFASSVKSEDQLSMLLEQYRIIRDQVCSLFPDAFSILQPPTSIRTLNECKIAIDQLVNYLTARAIPTFFEMLTSLRDAGLLQVGTPLAPLMPVLTELGLTINWVLGASALALIEVLINRKLEELGLDTGGSFDKRVRRLSEEARKRGITIPDLLAGPFYDARGKIIHRGKEPSGEELKIIFNYLYALSTSLREIKPKMQK